MINKKVLVVEDEILIQLYLADAVKKLGAEVIGAVTTGEEAVKIAMDKTPDLIFMDIRLAGQMDGLEAAREITAKKPVKIVFMSAFDFDERMKKANKPEITNFIGFLSKPVDMDEIKRFLEME